MKFLLKYQKTAVNIKYRNQEIQTRDVSYKKQTQTACMVEILQQHNIEQLKSTTKNTRKNKFQSVK